jgi:hypothetical protein
MIVSTGLSKEGLVFQETVIGGNYSSRLPMVAQTSPDE